MKKAPGILPNPRWLQVHGYHGLVRAMREQPEAFAHIRQESKKGRTPEEWVPEARTLARNHGGLLPNSRWLRQHGYSGLDIAMWAHPDLFAGIRKVNKAGPAAEEYLPQARRLARKHGAIPGPGWLIRNGYANLHRAMRKHPEVFSGIKQTRTMPRRASMDWLPVAERLAAKNDDLLPSHKWLRRHRYGGLVHALKKNSERFAHIQQHRNKKRRTIKEWLGEAGRLAREHGMLPPVAWLMKNGYANLDRAKRRRPQLFARIPQARANEKGQAVKKWVIEAERLARKYGILPGCGWLTNNGYKTLDAAKRRNPELFAHIPQAPRYSRKVLTP